MALQQTNERSNIFKDFDISFNFNPITGDVGSKTDTNSINQSIKNLINTNFYERPFQPEIGCNLRGFLFEVADPITIDNMRQAIYETINNYEPRVEIVSLRIDDLSDNNAYAVSLHYNIKNINRSATYETILKRLR